MTRPRAPRDVAAAGPRAVREVALALSFAVGLLAVLLAVALVAGHATVAVMAAVSFAAALLVAVVVLRRASHIAAVRTAALQQERRGREQLDRTLAAARRLAESETVPELRRRICEVARDVFECSAVSLWSVEDAELVLLEREPLVHPYTGADRRPIAELGGLREALDRAEPLFVEDVRARATGMTQATAEILGTRSLLNVPVVMGGVAELALVLTWDERLAAPGDAQRAAVQRFADQAGVVLEQARHRAALEEIAALNRTLSRMVQSDPLFRAGGTVDEVAVAICSEARRVFEADAAALWRETGDAVELLWREPHAAVFARRPRIAFAEHPAFAEVLAAGQPHFVADVEQEDPVLWERYARHSGSRSQLRLPLGSGGAARALIVLSWDRPSEPPSPDVAAITSRFADQAGVALAEAQRRAAEREAGALHARFERSLLPVIDLTARDAGVATFYRAGDDRLTLGGDFYDCLELDDGAIAVLIGDVAGHGPAAAAAGAGLRAAWRALVLGGWSLADLPAGLQAVLVRERADPYKFVTAILGHVDAARETFRYVSAGHPAPILVPGGALSDEDNGPPLGVVADGAWSIATVALARPSTILLYTDGLVEGRAEPGAAERRGIAPVEARVAEAQPGAVSGEDLERLVLAASSAHGGGLPDDVALLALNVGP